MVGCEWVVGFLALSAYPAGYGVISDLFGSLAVIAFVMWAFRFWVLLVPQGLAVGAACGVACEAAAVQARALDWH
jgi:hypothetical protein